MQIPTNFSLNIDQMIVLSGILLCLSCGLMYAKKITVSKKDVGMLIITWLLLTIIFSLFYIKLPKDMGAIYKFGFPHYFYSFWDSLDNKEGASFFHPLYLLANIGFFFTVSMVFLTILKIHKKS